MVALNSVINDVSDTSTEFASDNGYVVYRESSSSHTISDWRYLFDEDDSTYAITSLANEGKYTMYKGSSQIDIDGTYQTIYTNEVLPRYDEVSDTTTIFARYDDFLYFRADTSDVSASAWRVVYDKNTGEKVDVHKIADYGECSITNPVVSSTKSFTIDSAGLSLDTSIALSFAPTISDNTTVFAIDGSGNLMYRSDTSHTGWPAWLKVYTTENSLVGSVSNLEENGSYTTTSSDSVAFTLNSKAWKINTSNLYNVTIESNVSDALQFGRDSNWYFMFRPDTSANTWYYVANSSGTIIKVADLENYEGQELFLFNLTKTFTIDGNTVSLDLAQSLKESSSSSSNFAYKSPDNFWNYLVYRTDITSANWKYIIDSNGNYINYYNYEPSSSYKTNITEGGTYSTTEAFSISN